MATIYVRSTDGDNADNGSTWALAKATLAGAAGIDADGDTIYISGSHNESGGSATFVFANSIKIIGANDAAEPPTAVATTAVVNLTGDVIWNANTYTYGITFKIGATTSSNQWYSQYNSAIPRAVFDTCNFEFVGTSNGSQFRVYSNTVLRNCGIKFAATGQKFVMYSNGSLEWIGGSILSGSSTPTILCTSSSSGINGKVLIDGVDLSNWGTSGNYFFQSNNSYSGVIRNCKLPASWSGSLVDASGGWIAGNRFEMHNCDSADTNYRLWIETAWGSIKSETGIYNDAGADDGSGQGFSWKMVSASGASYPALVLRSSEIVRWNETTGSAITVTVEVVLDSATALNNDDCWLEVQYLGTSGFPLGSFITDCKADALATAAAQDSSSATWTGTGGFSNEQKRKLSVTFTPQEKGYIHAVVCLAKASTTVYVDPLLTVS